MWRECWELRPMTGRLEERGGCGCCCCGGSWTWPRGPLLWRRLKLWDDEGGWVVAERES